MSPVQTLHDFTLSLLRDPQVLSQFQADPRGMLSNAGLGDVTAADVHDVVPLVMDHLPAPVAEQFDRIAGADHKFAAMSMVNGHDSAIDQLHQITQHFSAVKAADPAAGVLGGGADGFAASLPRPLSVVDHAVNTVTDSSGLTPVVHNGAMGLNHAVDNLAASLNNSFGSMPVVGDVVRSTTADVTNAVGGVTYHAEHGTLVSAAADAVTNHLLDSALSNTASDILNQDAPALGSTFDTVRHDLAGQIQHVDNALGTTPVHAGANAIADHSVDHVVGQAGAVGAVAHTLTAHQVPVAQGLPNATSVVSRLTDTVHGSHGLPVAGVAHDVTGQVDHNLHAADSVHHLADHAQHSISGDHAGIGSAHDAHVANVPALHDFHLGL